MPTDWLPLVLQTSDPLFPTGAYAHSLGLEEIVRQGVVSDEATLRQYLETQMLPMLEHLELPCLRRAREAARGGEVERLLEYDRELSAIKVAAEVRAASRQIGGRRLLALGQIAGTPLLEELARRVGSGEAPGHHLTVFAAQMATAPLEATLQVWLYQSLAAACSAALKLIRIGQEACQRVLRACLEQSETVVARSLQIAAPDIGWFNPLLDIASLRHAVARERLFIS